MIYFKFNNISSVSDKSKRKVSVRILEDVLSYICNILLPHGNPDFEDKYVFVCKWYLEFNNELNETTREIGVDSRENIIVKAPYNHNRGFWVDEEFNMENYKKFNIQMITEQEFNALWDSVYYDRKAGEFKPCKGT